MLHCAVADLATGEGADEVIDIESRLELFVDRFLVAEMANARLKLHPMRKAPPSPKPALSGHYATVLAEGDEFRQYCRGAKVPGLHWRKDGWDVYHLAELTLLAESADGIHWTEPDLGLYTVERYPAGNVVLADQKLANHTHGEGQIRVELRDTQGKPFPGYALEDCLPLEGDEIDASVTWRSGENLSTLSGAPVIVRIVLRDADVFSLKFSAAL